MVYITGDIHGHNTIKKLSKKNWRDHDNCSHIIICGDFGLLWTNPPDAQEKYWIKWLSEKPWTTLFVDGNHENHPMLNALPVEEYCGARVGKVSHNIYHIKRGEVLELEGKKYLCIGGADSVDKMHRTLGLTWWHEELLSIQEQNNVFDNMKKHDYKFDYVITHTAPERAVIAFNTTPMSDPWFAKKANDPTARLLENVYEMIQYEQWYLGHFHRNWLYVPYKGPINFLYNDILEVGQSWEKTLPGD